VEARGLRRSYRVGSSEVRALDGVDLDIGPAEILAVVGVSGSGKSTLLHLLGALDTPTSGTVRFQGLELSSFSSRDRTLHRGRSVGFIFQSFHLIGSLTAEGNVALALTFQGLRGRERRRLALEALDRVGLGQRAAHRPAELSGGEQQRVAIARALVQRPPLVLADEPTGNLDRATAGDILGLLSGARTELGTTIVLVTHDEEAAGRFADRLVRLRDGRIDEGAPG
jgi:putative ABC transport system ATP-binding protein